MKDIDNIEDWYREELSNYNVEPEKNVWNSLSEELDADAPLTDKNISEWYKKEVAKLEERPDYTVWEKLSTRLDTSTVWDKLVVSLNRYDQIIWWRNLVFRGTAILLLFVGSYLAYNNYSTNNNSIANNGNITSPSGNVSDKSSLNNNVEINSLNEKITVYEAAYGNSSDNPPNENNSTNSIASVSDKFDNSSDVSSNESTSTPSEKYDANQTDEGKVNVAVKDAKKIVTPTLSRKRGRSKESVSYASLEKIEKYYRSIYVDQLNELKTNNERTIFTDINRHQLSERDVSHLYSKSEFLVKKNKNKIVFNSKRFSSYFMFGLYARRIYVGFNAGIKKQGIITKLKENSPLAEYKQNHLLDFGSNFGGTVGFIVSDNFNIETNINVNSTSGYKRAFDAEGISYQENLNLNYTSISLLAKRMNNKSTFDNKVYSTNLIGGVYASYLRSAVSNANGVSRNLDEYNKTDFGIVLGIEQDRYITKTFVITPGVRYNQGLTNIANDNNPFKSSRNFSFEFNLGIKYIFLKKGK